MGLNQMHEDIMNRIDYEPEIVEQAMNQVNEVWIGKQCKTCKLRFFCSAPIS